MICLLVRERHYISLPVVYDAYSVSKEQYLVNVEPEVFPRVLEAVAIILRQECSRCQVAKEDNFMVAIILAEHGFSGDVILRIVYSSLRLDTVHFQSDDHVGATRVKLIANDPKLVGDLAVDACRLDRIERLSRHFKSHEFLATYGILCHVERRLAVLETEVEDHASQ